MSRKRKKIKRSDLTADFGRCKRTKRAYGDIGWGDLWLQVRGQGFGKRGTRLSATLQLNGLVLAEWKKVIPDGYYSADVSEAYHNAIDCMMHSIMGPSLIDCLDWSMGFDAA